MKTTIIFYIVVVRDVSCVVDVLKKLEMQPKVPANNFANVLKSNPKIIGSKNTKIDFIVRPQMQNTCFSDNGITVLNNTESIMTNTGKIGSFFNMTFNMISSNLFKTA